MPSREKSSPEGNRIRWDSTTRYVGAEQGKCRPRNISLSAGEGGVHPHGTELRVLRWHGASCRCQACAMSITGETPMPLLNSRTPSDGGLEKGGGLCYSKSSEMGEGEAGRATPSAPVALSSLPRAADRETCAVLRDENPSVTQGPKCLRGY